MANFEWPPLESNPDIFTDYLRKVGLPQEWGINEVYGLDDELLAFVPQPTIGVIVAFQRRNRAANVALGEEANADTEYYMKQTRKLDNACGIVASIHAILNNVENKNIKLDKDSVLGKYAAKAKKLSPAERATLLENSNEFKMIHKEHAMQGGSAIITEQKNVVHHFVAFVINRKGSLVELDGTKLGPRVIKEKSEDVLRDSAAELKRRLTVPPTDKDSITQSLSVMTLSYSA